jgi:hypothetical protein
MRAHEHTLTWIELRGLLDEMSNALGDSDCDKALPPTACCHQPVQDAGDRYPFAMYDALSSIDVPPEKVRVVVRLMEKDVVLFATSPQFIQFDHYSGSQFDLLRSEIDGLRERMNERFEQAHTEIADFKLCKGQRLEQMNLLR